MPMMEAMSIEKMPTLKDIFVPWIIPDKTSFPFCVVPNQCLNLYGIEVVVLFFETNFSIIIDTFDFQPDLITS